MITFKLIFLSNRGFQLLLTLDLCGISFHAVVVFGLGKNLLSKTILGNCENVSKIFLFDNFFRKDFNSL